MLEDIHAHQWRFWIGGAAAIFIGLLSIAAGLFLLLFPLEGVVALTLVLIALFLAAGVVKCAYAWKLRDGKGWGWMLAAGLASLTFGVLIWTGLPGSAFWVLGLLVGIDLMLYGASLLALVIAARRRQPDAVPA